jgi:putative tryptophan/tyrosine transport system substrate-binding protein
MRRRGFITRRAFIVLLALTVAPLPALAQEPRKIRHIGFLRVGPPPPAFIDGFRRGLRELGYIEGQHFVIEYGSTIDPVAAGLVASLARPGKNITGMTSISGDVIAKRLQMITELLPGLTRVALLVRETSPDTGQYVRESQTAARNLGIELQVEIERKPKDLEGIFAAAQGAGAVVVADDAEFTSQRDQIAELALKNRLPTMSGLRELAEAGGLMAYGASFGDLYRRAASHVYKSLQGANVADIPIEQPVKFEFVLNMRTAKALGLTIPPSLLALADEVIE